MICPLGLVKIKGICYYQGESNAHAPDGYAQLFMAMIRCWRETFHDSCLPFLYVQLPNFADIPRQVGRDKWAYLRLEQKKALNLRHTGMVVAIDTGEPNDLHPMTKKEIGCRLSLQARKIA